MNQNNRWIDAVDSIADAVDRALIIASEADTPDALLARLAEARAGIVRVNVIKHVIDVAHDGNRTYADEFKPKPLDKAREFPKLQRQPKPDKGIERPGIMKFLKHASDFDCPSCGAEKHTACFKMTGPGHASKSTDERRTNGWVHNKRSALAAQANRAIRAKYDRDHFYREQES